MNNKEENEVFSSNEKISNIILLFLLVIRLIDVRLPIWIFGNNIPQWFPYWYAGTFYVLTVMIIWLNRHRLPLLNIDRPFVIALILGGALYIFFLTSNIGIIVGITTAFIYWAYKNNHLYLKNTIEYPPETVLLILLSILLALLPAFLFPLTIKVPLNLRTVITTLFETQLALIISEEIIFRGALWAFLRDLGLQEGMAFVFQALLFWVSHHKYLLLDNPYSFWVAVPLAAFLFGVIAWRSKSLSLTTVGHFLFNFTSILIKKML